MKSILASSIHLYNTKWFVFPCIFPPHSNYLKGIREVPICKKNLNSIQYLYVRLFIWAVQFSILLFFSRLISPNRLTNSPNTNLLCKTKEALGILPSEALIWEKILCLIFRHAKFRSTIQSRPLEPPRWETVKSDVWVKNSFLDKASTCEKKSHGKRNHRNLVSELIAT